MTRTELQADPGRTDNEPGTDEPSAPTRESGAVERLRYSTDNCSIARTIGVVGEKWTFIVLREAFSGIRRFADFQVATGAPRQVLSARLGRLVEEGLLRKTPYQEPGQRQRYEYRLTEKGLDLYPIMIALMHWGDRYMADPEGPSVVVTHRGCGAPVRQYFRCDEGHEVGGPREVSPRPGPGARIA
ncbi:helix-turn-helix domain-containing protein [Thermopolyspora sp. NPDC052614]|uniref:winged helix-turn-helix transcriptional regulator n=1 Tax=Thermopolyspora sp. NPDC052614 TaxID=3155682 RepID=UPI00343C4597